MKSLLDKIWWEVVCLDDAWSSRKSDYETHKCNGQDGNDISFTKKTFEEFVNKMKELTKNNKVDFDGEVK